MNLKNNTKGGEKMLNQVIFVGRLTKDIELQESENGNKYAVVTLAIPRTFKNAEGVYETDFISAKMFDRVAENCSEYCKKGEHYNFSAIKRIRILSNIIYNDKKNQLDVPIKKFMNDVDYLYDVYLNENNKNKSK